MVPRGTKAFQPTESRADCIKYPILILAQVFIGENLLSQANTVASVTEAELIFMCCMLKKRKVYLGYWIARTCQSISGRASCNLNCYHVLGAIFANGVNMTVVGRIPRLTYCPDPELFGMRFFKNMGILVQIGGRSHFYQVIKPDSQPERVIKKKTKKKQMEAVVVEEEKETNPQNEVVAPTTSSTPAVSPGHASLVELVSHLDDWRARMEGLLKRITLNTKRITLSSEA